MSQMRVMRSYNHLGLPTSFSALDPAAETMIAGVTPQDERFHGTPKASEAVVHMDTRSQARLRRTPRKSTSASGLGGATEGLRVGS